MKKIVIALAILGSGGVSQTVAQTLEEIKIAADAGDPVAQTKMAERDTANAEAWYRKAAKQGYVPAEGKLGELLSLRCRLTVGMKPDAYAATGEEAVKWATVAANQGDKQGEATLAQIYLDGKLVKQDLVEAYKWGDLSAKNPAPEFIVFSGGFTRDQAILKMNADQIEEAQTRVAAFVPHQIRQSDLPEPVWLNQIKLAGISGMPGHRLATINNKTFGPNDQLSLKIGTRKVSVQCLEIRESSVVVSIEGIDGKRELKLP